MRLSRHNITDTRIVTVEIKYMLNPIIDIDFFFLEFRVIYSLRDPEQPVGFSFISPSITSYSQTNPAYRVYSVDSNNFKIKNYDTYFFNLTEANEHNMQPNWSLEYRADDVFRDQTEFDFTNFHYILKKLESDNDAFETYYRRYYVQSELDIAKVWDLTRRELILRDHKVKDPFKTAPSNLIPVL